MIDEFTFDFQVQLMRTDARTGTIRAALPGIATRISGTIFGKEQKGPVRSVDWAAVLVHKADERSKAQSKATTSNRGSFAVSDGVVARR